MSKIIDNGVIVYNVTHGGVYLFRYNHNKAIEGAMDKFMVCTVYIVSNTYIKSIIDLIGAKTVRFVNHSKIPYSDTDIIESKDTDSIVLGYEIIIENNKYFRKILIEDGDIVAVKIKDNKLIGIEINKDIFETVMSNLPGYAEYINSNRKIPKIKNRNK